jgi:hypothetical protein
MVNIVKPKKTSFEYGKSSQNQMKDAFYRSKIVGDSIAYLRVVLTHDIYGFSKIYVRIWN